MAKNKGKSNFIIQGSILAVAGILVRVIGLVYRVPLNNILGNSGISAYATAYDVYSLFLLISSLSLPLAVSKIVSARMAKKQIRNAYHAFIGSMVLASIVGFIVGSGVYFGADWLAKAWKFPSAALSIKVLAPTLFVMCILGVLRGFFQGLGTMVPTAVSQIFEQIVNAVVSIGAAMYLYKVGEKVGQENAYSAAGGTLGTACGALAALVFMVFLYFMQRKNFLNKVSHDRTSVNESFAELSKILAITILPVLLSTTIYNFSNIIDSGIYGNVMSGIFGQQESEYSGYWGIYSNKYRLLTTAPIAIASAFSSAMIPSLIKSLVSGKNRELRKKVDSTIRLNMIIAIPCGAGLSVLAEPIIKVLFPGPDLYEECVLLMRLAVFSVVVFSLSTITNSILQGIDRMKVPVIHSSISLALHIVVILFLLAVLKLNVYGVAIADIIFGLVVCILNARAIKRYLKYRQEIVKTFILPGLSAAIMGAGAYGFYRLLFLLTGMTAVALLAAIVFAMILYGILLLVFNVVSEEEIRMIPKGYKLIPLIKKLGLLK